MREALNRTLVPPHIRPLDRQYVLANERVLDLLELRDNSLLLGVQRHIRVHDGFQRGLLKIAPLHHNLTLGFGWHRLQVNPVGALWSAGIQHAEDARRFEELRHEALLVWRQVGTAPDLLLRELFLLRHGQANTGGDFLASRVLADANRGERELEVHPVYAILYLVEHDFAQASLLVVGNKDDLVGVVSHRGVASHLHAGGVHVMDDADVKPALLANPLDVLVDLAVILAGDLVGASGGLVVGVDEQDAGRLAQRRRDILVDVLYQIFDIVLALVEQIDPGRDQGERDRLVRIDLEVLLVGIHAVLKAATALACLIDHAALPGVIAEERQAAGDAHSHVECHEGLPGR